MYILGHMLHVLKHAVIDYEKCYNKLLNVKTS